MEYTRDETERGTLERVLCAAPYLPGIDWWRSWLSAGMPAFRHDMPVKTHGGRIKGWNELSHTLIDSPAGALTLTIPTCKLEYPHSTVADIRISSHGDWRHKHWHALESTYYNSPYFEYYYDDLRRIYDGSQEFLYELNEELLALVVRLLRLDDESVVEGLKSYAGHVPTVYYQVFGSKHGFIAGLGIADLLFNHGPEGVLWLR